MRAGFLTLLGLQAVASAIATPVATAGVSEDLQQIADLAQQAFEEAQNVAQSGVDKRTTGTCTWDKVRIRKEWGSLSAKERKSYIAAVKCLQAKPAKTPSDIAPGAKTRFDDFVATHINQTTTIHYTGNFLSWHRYFTWLYEDALRSECGYTGTQPYWDWAKTAQTGLANSPIFDGSDTSMSGNGEFIPNQQNVVLGASMGLPPLYLPPGTGGGCVTSGPFKNLTVNLGPAALDLPGGISLSNPNGPLSYNPRCLKRDLTDYVNQRFANATAVLDLLLGTSTVYDFQMVMQGVPGSDSIGVHGGGHYTLGGDPGRDVFTSPGDPMFYLHHSMIDRVWWIWQMLDTSTRLSGTSAISGTNTFMNMPPSADTTLNDYVSYGFAAGPPRKINELLSTLSGPFCYVYM